jgi:hypothetical protein
MKVAVQGPDLMAQLSYIHTYIHTYITLHYITFTGKNIYTRNILIAVMSPFLAFYGSAIILWILVYYIQLIIFLYPRIYLKLILRAPTCIVMLSSYFLFAVL